MLMPSKKLNDATHNREATTRTVWSVAETLASVPYRVTLANGANTILATRAE